MSCPLSLLLGSLRNSASLPFVMLVPPKTKPFFPAAYVNRGSELPEVGHDPELESRHILCHVNAR